MNFQKKPLYWAVFFALMLLLAIQTGALAATVNQYVNNDGGSLTAGGGLALYDPMICFVNGTITPIGPTLARNDCTYSSRSTATLTTSALCGASVCTNAALTTQATCTNAGYAWVAKGSWGNACSIPGLTTQAACTAAGGTWGSQCRGNTTNRYYYGNMQKCSDPSYTNQAACEGAGATWLQYQSGNNGCLHCHNPNGQESGAQKQHHLLTGHHNAMRKVAGSTTSVVHAPVWGPATTFGGVDWSSSMATVITSTGAQDFAVVPGATSYATGLDSVKYLIGGWYRNIKEAQISRTGVIPQEPVILASSSDYDECARCHTTGYSKGGTNVNSLGADLNTKGADQPDNGFENMTNDRWYVEGVVCNRCHSNQWAAKTSSTTGPWTGSHTQAPSNMTTTDLCRQCHVQEVPGLAPYQVAAKDGVLVDDYRTNQFLNSPHARFTGTAGQVNNWMMYSSTFGSSQSLCVSRTISDPATCATNTSTNAWGSVQGSQPICYNTTRTSSSTCTSLAGFGGVYGSGVCSALSLTTAATCTTSGGVWTSFYNNRGCDYCHDPHYSSVDPRVINPKNSLSNIKSSGHCQSCHSTTSTTATRIDLTKIAHPTGPGTPLDNYTDASNNATKAIELACVTCHMGPKTNHFWRINTNTSYATIASTQGVVLASTQTDPDGYADAVWNDLDMACGQCHGGSGTAKAGISAFTKDQLAVAASGIHTGITDTNYTTVNPQCLTCHGVGAGGAPVITPGANHHGQHVACTTCHAAPQHKGTSATNGGKTFAVDGNDFCLTCHGNTGTHAHHHVTPALKPEGKNCQACHNYGGMPITPSMETNAACMGCHNQSWAKYQGQTPVSDATLTIAPNFGPGKNHHGAHAECVECHNEGPAYVAIDATHSGVAFDSSPNAFCQTCHAERLDAMNHPTGSTPAPYPNCETCHAYSIGSGATTTFYSFAGVKPTDTEHVCGQCHGGSAGSGATTNGAPYLTELQLSGSANNIHGVTPVCNFTWQTDPAVDYRVLFNASGTQCPVGGSCIYSWSTGETGGVTASHTFASTATTTVTLAVLSSLGGSCSISKPVTPAYVAATPTSLSGVSITPNGYSPSVNWTVGGGVAPYTISTNWGDGANTSTSQPAAGTGSTSHTFVSSGTYTVTITARDSGVGGINITTAQAKISVTISPVSVSGLVTTSTGTPLSGVSLSLQQGGVTKKLAITAANGTYAFTNVAPGCYTVVASKSGYTFANPVASFCVDGSDVTGVTIAANAAAAAVNVTGKVTRSDGTTAVSGVSLSLKLGGVTKYLASTDASGIYTFQNVANGSYTITASKSGYTFGSPAATVTVSGSTVTQNINSVTP